MIIRVKLQKGKSLGLLPASGSAFSAHSQKKIPAVLSFASIAAPYWELFLPSAKNPQFDP